MKTERYSLFLLIVTCWLCTTLPNRSATVRLDEVQVNGVLAVPSSSAANAVDVSAHLQAAIDQAGVGGTVIIPSHMGLKWYLKWPVFVDKSNITICGTGDDESVLSTYTEDEYDADNSKVLNATEGISMSIPTLIAGMPRQVAGKEITPGHRVNLTGILDGHEDDWGYARYGLRTKARNTADTADVYTHGYFPPTSVAASGPKGEYWRSYTRWRCPWNQTKTIPKVDSYKFSWDVAIRNNAAGTLLGTIAGAGMSEDINDRFTYWKLGTFPNDPVGEQDIIKFKFKTGDPTNPTTPPQVYEIWVGRITDNAVHRICIQMDLSTGQCGAWMDNVWVYPTPAVNTPTRQDKGSHFFMWGDTRTILVDGIPDPNKELWPYEMGGLHLGAITNGILGQVTNDGLNQNVLQRVDWTYCGFSFREGANVYQWTPLQNWFQGRIGDPGPPTDHERYFCNVAMSFALRLKENPTQEQCDSRGLGTLIWSYNNKGRATVGFWMPERVAVQDVDGLYGLTNLTLNNFTSKGPIFLGEGRNINLERVAVNSESVYQLLDLHPGIMNGDALATIVDNHCQLAAGQHLAQILYASRDVRSMNLNVAIVPEQNILLYGCRGKLTHTFSSVGVYDYFYRSLAGPRGGALTIDYNMADNEGGYVEKAFLYHEFGPLGHGVTRANNILTFSNTFPGSYGNLTPAVLIPNVGEGVLNVFFIQRHNDVQLTQSFARIANPNVTGTLFASSFMDGMAKVIDYQGPTGTTCKVVSRHFCHENIPDPVPYYQGAIIHNPNPIVDNPTSWILQPDGTWGGRNILGPIVAQ